MPLGYFSRHLPIDKVNWATYRKELLAAQSGLRHFITDIYGKHCIIYSDHMPLINAYNGSGFQLHDPVAQRSLMEISQFTRDIRHISGVDNEVSDYFSRIKPEKLGTVYQSDTTHNDQTEQIASVEGHKLESVSPLTVFEAQQSCQEVMTIKNNDPDGVLFGPTKFSGIELWCELSGSKPRPILPKSLRNFVIKQLEI